MLSLHEVVLGGLQPLGKLDCFLLGKGDAEENSIPGP